MTKKELNAIIEYQSDCQNRLMLLVENAYRYYEKNWLGQMKSTKTYEEGLLTAQEVLSDFLNILLKKPKT